MNIAPVCHVSGKVRRVTTRTVPAVLAAPAPVDPETGRTIGNAREARAAYDVIDVVVDTLLGGFAKVIITPEAQAHLSGVLPSEGDAVTYPCRTFVAWEGTPGRKYATVGYSLAGDLAAASETGRRTAEVPKAS